MDQSCPKSSLSMSPMQTDSMFDDISDKVVVYHETDGANFQSCSYKSILVTTKCLVACKDEQICVYRNNPFHQMKCKILLHEYDGL